MSAPRAFFRASRTANAVLALTKRDIFLEAAAMGGTALLARFVVQDKIYRNLIKLLPDQSPPLLPVLKPDIFVGGSKPNAFVYGRQSALSLPDDKRLPCEKRVDFLSTQMLNEQHFVNFERMMHSKSYQIITVSGHDHPPIERWQMCGDNLQDMKGVDFELVGCARKLAFDDMIQEIPHMLAFYHAALCYTLHPADKPVNPDTIILTAAEVQEILAETDKHICQEQFCNLITSNCYSALIYALISTIKLIDRRPDDQSHQNSADIKAIAALIKKVGQDNFSCGLSTNPVVLGELHKLFCILEKRHLLDNQPTLGGPQPK